MDIAGWRMPQGAWQHVFPVGRVLHVLEMLSLNTQGELLDQRGLQSLVRCCPRLKSLRFSSVCAVGAPLTPLLQLAQLSSLSVPGLADTEASLGVVAQLTGLQDLHNPPPSNLSEAGLLRLTSLTCLTYLGTQEVNLYQQVRQPLSSACSTCNA
jgi:hypothetical protein